MENNKVKEFLNERFGEVRTINKDGELWFVASDVAKALDYLKAGDMTRNLEDDEADTQSLLIRSESGVEQQRDVLLINESGLYGAVLSITKRNQARYEKAKEFKRWITKEVIPAIRQDGMYVNREEEMESVEELNRAIDKAFERKILRKYGIGVRKDLTSTIHNHWLIRNKYQMATYTNELVYKPLFGKTAKELKEEYQATSLRDELFTEEELVNIANVEGEIATLVEFGSTYYQIKDYMNNKYARK